MIATIRPHEIKPAVAPPAWLTSRVRQWPFEYQVTLHQETADASRPQALAFQFQLPGQTETWMDGTTSSIPSQTPGGATAPGQGPAVPAGSRRDLRDGMVQFKLSCAGAGSPAVGVPRHPRDSAGPRTAGAQPSQSNGNPIDLDTAELTSDGTAELWVRPQFRAAPELEGQWIPSESTIYLWRHRNGDLAGGQVDVRALESLQEQGDSGVKTFKAENAAANGAVKVMPRRVRLSLLGWPRRPASERYSLVASVVYRPREVPASSGAAANPPTDRVIAEWSDIYTVQLNTPWVVPLCWWPIAAILVVGVIAAGPEAVGPQSEPAASGHEAGREYRGG